MQITRSSVETQKGPADWFTGDVWIDAVAAPAGSSTFAAALVHFTPGARTAWHTHPHGQTIFMAHLAIHQQDDTGSTVSWGEHVSDAQYAAPRANEEQRRA